VHRKSLPRLAPKIKYPRHVRKRYIETYRERDPNPSAGSSKQKKLPFEGQKRWPEWGGKVIDNMRKLIT